MTASKKTILLTLVCAPVLLLDAYVIDTTPYRITGVTLMMLGGLGWFAVGIGINAKQ